MHLFGQMVPLSASTGFRRAFQQMHLIPSSAFEVIISHHLQVKHAPNENWKDFEKVPFAEHSPLLVSSPAVNMLTLCDICSYAEIHCARAAVL